MGAKRWWRSWTGLAEERRGNHGYSVRRPNAISPGQDQARPVGADIPVLLDPCIKLFDHPGGTTRLYTTDYVRCPPGHNRNDANPPFEFRELPRPDRRGQHQDSEQCQHRAYQSSSVHWVTSFLNRLD